MNALKALLFLAGLGGIYAIVYTMNRRTPIPAGCENIKTGCIGCNVVACGNHPAQQDEIKEMEERE